VQWLHLAVDLTASMFTYFWDEENGGFYATSSDHETLIQRTEGLGRQCDSQRQLRRTRCSPAPGGADRRRELSRTRGACPAALGIDTGETSVQFRTLPERPRLLPLHTKEIAIIGDLSKQPHKSCSGPSIASICPTRSSSRRAGQKRLLWRSHFSQGGLSAPISRPRTYVRTSSAWSR